MKTKFLYFFQDMWKYNWKASVKLSVMWAVITLIVEDIVYGWYDVDWLVIFTGLVGLFVIRLVVPALYHIFDETEKEDSNGGEDSALL